MTNWRTLPPSLNSPQPIQTLTLTHSTPHSSKSKFCGVGDNFLYSLPRTMYITVRGSRFGALGGVVWIGESIRPRDERLPGNCFLVARQPLSPSGEYRQPFNMQRRYTQLFQK